MIVSKFTNAPQGALQGFDFLPRSGGSSEREASPSSFSELLGGSNGPGFEAPVQRDLRHQFRGTTATSGGKGATDVEGVIEPSRVVGSQLSAGPTAEQPAVKSTLDEAPPIFRDPRLDDPAELALEAAAIALAASLLAQPQDLALVCLPVAEEKVGYYCGSEQGSTYAEDSVSSQDEQAGASGALALEVGELVQPESVLAAAEVVTARRFSFALASAPQQASDSQGAPNSVAPDFSVVPNFSASVVVNATQQQAAALADGGDGLVLTQKTDPALSSNRSAVFAPSSSLDASNADARQIVELGADLGQSNNNPALSHQEVSAEAPSDAELLASPIPANPAAAFFAAQVQGPKEQSNGQAADLESLKGESKGHQVMLGVVPDADTDPVPQASPEFEGHGGTGHPGAERSDAQAQAEHVRLYQASNALPLEEAEVGTFGAKDSFVYSEVSPTLERTDESSTPVTTRVQESSSLSASSADSSSTLASFPSVAADASRPEHTNVSRPTVLAPVHVRSNELFNVVQNALERARSENPSHLAVEVTLDDGSSFGLEVRMSASGLQASFRSESRPLLKALESNWAGFLAKETAESKIVSAAFEGRSGFGEFSNNGSGAGERREQFEDNAAASFLSGGGAKVSPKEVSTGEGAGKASGPEAGTTVYA